MHEVRHCNCMAAWCVQSQSWHKEMYTREVKGGHPSNSSISIGSWLNLPLWDAVIDFTEPAFIDENDCCVPCLRESIFRMKNKIQGKRMPVLHKYFWFFRIHTLNPALRLHVFTSGMQSMDCGFSWQQIGKELKGGASVLESRQNTEARWQDLCGSVCRSYPLWMLMIRPVSWNCFLTCFKEIRALKTLKSISLGFYLDWGV